MKKLVMILVVLGLVNVASADIIRGIDINFVTIGNAGNAGDTRAEANPYGCGAVSDGYRIGKYEVTNAQWNAFTAASGAPTGDQSYAYDQSALFTGAQQPTNCVSWYEAAQFCNYLTSGDKSRGVYQFSGNNSNPGDFLGIDRAAAKVAYGTTYFLPTEDEWYKAAYYKPDGSGYSLYANGQNTIPAADNGWNYDGGSYSEPWNVGTGTMEQNGTFDMMGNVWEWNESLLVADTYFLTGSYRVCRGGCYLNDGPGCLASAVNSYYSHWQFNDEGSHIGFRVASIPEPAIAATVDIDPDTLNLQSKGKWITCYIWLPEDYNVVDINSASVVLHDTIKAEWTWVEEEDQSIMAKFSRSAVQSILTLGQVELTITGSLNNGIVFEGKDTITVINKGKP